MWEKIKILLIKIKNALIGISPNVDEITNIYQARDVYENMSFFCSHKTRKIIAAKWDDFSSIELAIITTADQARKAYRNSRPNSKTRKIIAPKWDELSFIEIDSAKTVEQARRACHDSRPGSKAEKKSIIKWDELSLKQVSNANTIDDIKRANVYSRTGSKAEKDSYFKQDKILLKLISEAKAVTDIQVISRNYLSFGNEKIKEAINKKIEELSNNKDF